MVSSQDILAKIKETTTTITHQLTENVYAKKKHKAEVMKLKVGSKRNMLTCGPENFFYWRPYLDALMMFKTSSNLNHYSSKVSEELGENNAARHSTV